MYAEGVSALEDLEISPLLRFRKYGVFPWRATLQLLAISAIITEIALLNLIENDYSRAFDRNWLALLFSETGTVPLVFSDEHERAARQPGFDYDMEDFRLENFIEYRTTVCASDVRGIVRSYYALPSTAVDRLDVANASLPDGGGIALPAFSYTTMDAIGGTSITNVAIRSVSDLGPLASTDPFQLAEFFHTLVEMRLKIAMHSYSPTTWRMAHHTCVRWEYTFRFDRPIGGTIQGHAEQSDASPCTAHDASLAVLAPTPFGVALFVVLSLSASHAALACIRILKGLRLLYLLRRRYQRHSVVVESDDARPVCPTTAPSPTPQLPPSRRVPCSVAGAEIPARLGSKKMGSERLKTAELAWDDVLCVDKLALVNIWVLLSLVGDIVALAWCIVELCDSSSGNTSSRYTDVLDGVLASALFFDLLGLIEYIEYGLVNYLFVQVFSISRWELFKIFLGITPVFVGFCLLGTVLYSDQVSRFSGPVRSAITLFSVLQGDEVRDTFMDLSGSRVPLFVTSVYMTTFSLIFLVAVTNIFIAIVELAFIENGLWLLDVKASGRQRRAQRDFEHDAVRRAVQRTIAQNHGADLSDTDTEGGSLDRSMEPFDDDCSECLSAEASPSPLLSRSSSFDNDVALRRSPSSPTQRACSIMSSTRSAHSRRSSAARAQIATQTVAVSAGFARLLSQTSIDQLTHD